MLEISAKSSYGGSLLFTVKPALRVEFVPFSTFDLFTFTIKKSEEKVDIKIRFEYSAFSRRT